MEVLTVPGNGMRLFEAKAFPLIVQLVSRICHTISVTTFNGFSYNVVLTEHRAPRPNIEPRVLCLLALQAYDIIKL